MLLSTEGRVTFGDLGRVGLCGNGALAVSADYCHICMLIVIPLQFFSWESATTSAFLSLSLKQ